MDLISHQPNKNLNTSTQVTPPSTQLTPPSLSRYENQKRRDWNTFCQYLRNHRPPLSLPSCSGEHVVDFLRYLDQFGKTKVHHQNCAFFGLPNPPAPCPCPLRQAWGSLDALIDRLRAAYEDNGGPPEANPFGSRAVRLYLRQVRDWQSKARGVSYEKKRKRVNRQKPQTLSQTQPPLPLQQQQPQQVHPAGGKSSDLPLETAQPSLPVEKAGCTTTKPPLLKLHFINSPPPLIFTDSKIEADDGSPIAIELVDAATNTRVTLDSRLEIVLLHGDFPGESWTTEEFNRNIIRSREGKRPLLVGDLTVTLKDGVGVIGGDVAFTDNASRKFRLGAKATQGGVVEAISEAFVCKDHRGVSAYRKHHPPYPDSEVWRLENIPEGGVTDTCFPGSQSVFLNRAFSDTSDVFGPLRTCATSSPFEDYDVVIRYGRGDVSNDDFISHLRAALYRRGISVDSEFDEGDAVPECRVLIILLTSTYVPSNLSNILEHQHTENRVVYPIFYRLSPYDFVCNSKNYESSFLQEEPQRWQDALKEISQMPGYTLTDKSESELIDEIVRDTLKVLCSGDKVNMTGMDMQVEEILSLLCIESLDVRSIGIWGTVGIGKTTIAKEIFRRISVQYETCIFLKDLHKQVEVKGHDAVREYFLSKVLEVEPHVIRISDIKTSFLRSRLQRKRVLVILDDVKDYRDVETFLGRLNHFGPGSRIIVTSRNRRVFVLCKIDHVYEVKPLDIPNSLLLLDRGAFQIALSPEVYRTLSLELVKFSNGNPQVLQFLSSTDREWNRLSQEVQKTSPIYIPGIFERSCCGLDDNERSIFLDIACFFNRMDKDNVAMLLDGCGFSAHVGFRGLVEKSLLTISHHNLVDMLSYIQATGREIVRQESADRPEDRSRLWNAEDIRDVFINDTGTSAIEGIFLDMLSLEFDANPNVFEKMCNLRLLKLYCSKVEKHAVSFTRGLEYLPSKLRLLHWEYYPLSSLPKSFNPENLVELNLPNSCAKKLWKGKKSLEKLKKMRLSYSYQLTKIPRLSSAPNLELLDLEGCNSLLSISQSITYIKKLVFLNLKDCSKLESIPSMVDVESLEVLNLSGCSKLENFPEISPNVKELYMGGTMIQEIPSSIKKLVLLEKLDLENCRHLKNLPTSICKLKHLEILNLSGCTSLERFPDLSRRMKCLRFLDLSRTAIKELPSSIWYLTALEELRYADSRNVVRLPVKPIDLQGSSRDFLTHITPKSERLEPIYLQESSSDFRTHVAPKSETIKRPSSSSASSENGCDEEEAMKEEVETEGMGALFTQLGDMADEACSITTNKGDSLRKVSNISPIYASGGSTIKSWQKGQLLGRGSFGAVYEGISEDGDFFAVKEVSLLEVSLLFQGRQAQECIEQLVGEIALLSQLQHQNILQYRGTAKDELNLYIFLELVTQGSLLKLYKIYQLRDSVVSLYTRQILDGLKYLHDRGFIHRNIKCANVLVDANGAVKLADFGLAKVSKLFDMKFLRDPFWMAPEVINRKRSNGYGSPADIWSLGCTVLEMLTGQIPYSNWEPVAALFRIGTGKLPEIPDTLSVDARHFILRCLQVNPEERPTVNELLNHPFVRRPLPSSGSGSDSAISKLNNNPIANWDTRFETGTKTALLHPFSPIVVAADENERIRVWNYEEATLLNGFDNHDFPDKGISKLCLVNELDDSMLLVASCDGSVRIWKNYATKGKQKLVTGFSSIQGHKPGARDLNAVVDWQQQSGYLYASGEVSTVTLWDLEKEQLVRSIPSESECGVTALSASHVHGGQLAAGFTDGSLRLYDVRSPEPLVCATRPHLKVERVVGLSFQPGLDPAKVVSASQAGDIQFLDLRTTRDTYLTIDAHRGSLTALAVHRHAPIIASGSAKQLIKVFNLQGEQLGIIRYHPSFMAQKIGSVSCLTFHPYQVLLAAGTADSFVSIYTHDNSQAS